MSQLLIKMLIVLESMDILGMGTTLDRSLDFICDVQARNKGLNC
jgi:hypothetical protein